LREREVVVLEAGVFAKGALERVESGDADRYGERES
jgi:hypothetical protein